MEILTEIEEVTAPGHFLTMRIGPFKSKEEADQVELAITAYLTTGKKVNTQVLDLTNAFK